MSGNDDTVSGIRTHYLGDGYYADVAATDDPKDITHINVYRKPQEPRRPILQRLKDYFKK